MTARRKDDGNIEVLSWGPGTKAYRFILLGAVLAATPIGQNVLNSVGIKTPVADELAGLKVQSTALKVQVEDVNKDVHSLKDDVAALKTDVAAVKVKSDHMEQVFGVFQVDFEKYRKEPK